MGVLSRKMALQTSPKDTSVGVFRFNNRRNSNDHTLKMRKFKELAPLMRGKYDNHIATNASKLIKNMPNPIPMAQFATPAALYPGAEDFNSVHGKSFAEASGPTPIVKHDSPK